MDKHLVSASAGSAYYQENYADYERQNSEEKMRFYDLLVDRWVKRNGKVLEFGCALGHYLGRIVDRYQCSACDINEFGISKAREKFPNTPLWVGSYEVIPADARFDGIVSWDVLEHLPNIEEGLTVLRSHLDQDGFLIAVVPIYDGFLGWLVRLLDHDPTHVTKVGRYQWIAMLEKSGFKVVEKGAILRKLVGKNYLHFTGPKKLLWYFGSAMYFVAKRG